MRVTANSFPIDLRLQLAELSERQSLLQTRASSGQRVENVADDPRAMHKILALQEEQRTLTQYQKNISNVRESVDIGFTAIEQLKKIFDRASEIATQADAAKSKDEIRTYAHEVNQLAETALQLSNTRHRNVYLFAGTKNLTVPFTATRDSSGQLLAATYNGNEKVNQVDVAENSLVESNFTGAGPVGVLKNNLGADFIKHLIDLRNELAAVNVPAIKETITQGLRKDEDMLVDHFSRIGATQVRLDTAEAIAKKRAFSLEPLISKEADVDLADTLVRLNEIQNAYVAALQTGGTLLSTSLLDYLR